MTVTILTGDCRDLLRTLPEASVHACVTSPPYFGLRDYGVDGQIGLEATPDEFVAELVAVFREVRRVLRDDGTLWLNLGDSYAMDSKWGGSTGGRHAKDLHGGGDGRKARRATGLPDKNLIGIPWLVAFALRSDGAASPSHMRDIERMIGAVTASYETREQWPDRIAQEVERLEREHIDANRGGWYLRQDIIWSKPNPMPESVRDRCTKAHEYLFLLSKSERYYFDSEAISEESVADHLPGNRSHKGTSAYEAGDEMHRTKGGLMAYAEKQGSRRNSFARETKSSAGGHGQTPQHRADREDIDYTGRRNRRSVWTVATQPFKEAHFATFPPELIEPCIAAGAPSGGTVLDPFGGAGTTGLVAETLGRDSILIEMNPEYAQMAHRRTMQRGLTLPEQAA